MDSAMHAASRCGSSADVRSHDQCIGESPGVVVSLGVRLVFHARPEEAAQPVALGARHDVQVQVGDRLAHRVVHRDEGPLGAEALEKGIRANIDRCWTCRSMFMQAWGNYGTAWAVVHQWLGVRPNLGSALRLPGRGNTSFFAILHPLDPEALQRALVALVERLGCGLEFADQPVVIAGTKAGVDKACELLKAAVTAGRRIALALGRGLAALIPGRPGAIEAPAETDEGVDERRHPAAERRQTEGQFPTARHKTPLSILV